MAVARSTCLAWLNDYALARCICDLEVPVLTGIGHERDSTVLDEMAHRRFDTPSKAIAGIEQLIAQRARHAQEHFQFVVHTARHQLQQARQDTAQAVAHVRLQAAQSVRLGSEQSRALLGEVRHQASAHMGAARQPAQLQLVDVLAQGRHALHTARASMQARLHGVLERAAAQTTPARDNADRAIDEVAAGARRALADGAQRSQALVREITGQGPHKTLGRGFAIVRRTGGTVVTGSAGLAAREAINIESGTALWPPGR